MTSQRFPRPNHPSEDPRLGGEPASAVDAGDEGWDDEGWDEDTEDPGDDVGTI